MVIHDEPGRNSRRSSDTKVPSDGLSDGSTHDSELHRSRQSKQDFTSLEAFANPKRENWCDVRDDDDSDQDPWLSASPFKETASPISPATPSRRRPVTQKRRSRESPREATTGKVSEAPAQQTPLPGSVVTVADIGFPCSAPPVGPGPAKAPPPAAPPVWPGIMSTSPIEQPRPAVFLPCGALGASGGPPVGSPINACSAMPVGSPTGDASTRAIYAGSPTFMGPPMTPTPVDPSLRGVPQWPDASPPAQYQPCGWPWPPAGIPPAPCGPPMAPAMMPPTWPQEPQWHPGGMAPWPGVQQGPPAYMVVGEGMAGYSPHMEA